MRLIKYLASSFHSPLTPEDEILADEVTIWSCHAICQHGFHSPPNLASLRISLLTGVVLGLITYVSYSAKLVSMFSFQTLPIKGIEDLVRSNLEIVIDVNNARARILIEVRAEITFSL